MTDGWKCPVCSRGVSPTEKTCDHGGGSKAAPDHEPPYFPPDAPAPWWPSYEPVGSEPYQCESCKRGGVCLCTLGGNHATCTSGSGVNGH